NILINEAVSITGKELYVRLRNKYRDEEVLPTDIRMPEDGPMVWKPIEILEVPNKDREMEMVGSFQPDSIIHLAALLSATAEKNPALAWDVNMGGLFNTIEAARIYDAQYFTPSSIGSFGPSTPKENTPQDTTQRPTTMYGVNKVTGELLMDYYYTKFGVDTRSVRFPGLISYVQEPGGGTTD